MSSGPSLFARKQQPLLLLLATLAKEDTEQVRQESLISILENLGEAEGGREGFQDNILLN